MQNYFVILNSYLARRKRLFFILLLPLLGVAGYIASGVKLEENLNAIIPEDTRISKISEVFDKSELADQIVFILSRKDTSEVNPGALIEKAERLVELLGQEEGLVREISFKTGNAEMMEVYDFIYDNLPLFLSDSDYEQLKGMLSQKEIDQAIGQDFRTIISPAGLAAKDYILRDPLNLTPVALKKLNQFQMDDNFILYGSAVFTKDKKHLLFFLDPVYPGSNTQENLKLIEFIDRSIESLADELDGTIVQYYGGTAVAVANSVRVKKDITLTVSIALAFFLLIFLAFFRRLKVIILMFLPVVIGAGFSVAMLTLIYGKVSAIALGIGVIFIGITVDYSLHFFTHYRSGGSVSETIRRISVPVLMSSLTTASAFLCLTIVKSEALNQIGVFAAFAVLITAVSVLILTPLLISEEKDMGRAGPESRRPGLAERILGFRFEKSRILVGLVLLFTVVFAFTSQRLRFNGDISTLNYLTESLAEAEAKLKSISSVANSSVYLVTQAGSLGEAMRKLETNQRLIRECQEDGLITEVSWISELMLTENAQKERIAQWDRFWEEAGVEGVKAAIRQSGTKYHFRENAFDRFFSLLDRRFEPIPLSDYDLLRDLFLENYIGFEDGTCSVVSILKAEAGKKDALFQRFAATSDFIIFDNQYFINQFFEVLKEDFNKLVIISMTVVFLILLLFFGRIEIAVITFIPIMISWLWALGLMGLFNIEINVFNIIISTFVFGLGIDYCIFIMNGIIAGYREGEHSLVPYKLSIFLSALTTITGIGVLIFAQHPALKSIAIVSIFGISTVVLISYTLLPLLFSFLTRSRGKQRLQPLTFIYALLSIIPFILFLGSALIITLLLPLFALFPLGRRPKKRFISYIIYLFSNFIVGISFFVKKRYINRELLDFDNPSVIISNHQSQLDLLFLLSQHPRIIVLVNRWVWNNPFYGFIIRYADFYPVYKGLDHNLEKIRSKVKEGYSILAFPEASRSPDGKIKRFHQGAFGIADMLGLTVQPVMIHGAYDSLPKSEYFVKPGAVTLKCFPRLKVQAVDYGGARSYRTQAKELTAFYRREFSLLKAQLETPGYLKRKLIAQYIYKGPVLEWYVRVKLKLENSYVFLNEIIPREASVVDLGCGYGYLAIMLGYVSGNRRIVGMDYDEEKIRIAKNVVRNLENIHFMTGDITREEIPPGEVYILNDVLHYLPEEKQLMVVEKCLEKIPEGGKVILRDADTELRKRTAFTKFTEFQSTRIFRFNKTRHRLTYLSGSKIENFVKGKGFKAERFDHARLTSNITYVITR
jgi:1-acyl-sn-glycerol-3-phosphate acyltransferase